MGVDISPVRGFIQAQDSLNLLGQTSTSQIHVKSPKEIRLLRLDESAIHNGVVRVPYGITEVCTQSLPVGTAKVIVPKSVVKLDSCIIKEPERVDWQRTAFLAYTKGVELIPVLEEAVKNEPEKEINFRDMLSAVELCIEDDKYSRGSPLRISEKAVNILLDSSNTLVCADRIETLNYITTICFGPKKNRVLKGGVELKWLSPKFMKEFYEIDLSRSVNIRPGAIDRFLKEGWKLANRVAEKIILPIRLLKSLSEQSLSLLGKMFMCIDFV